MNHLTTQQIETYQDGNVEAAEECLAIEAHLAECEACRENVARSRTLSTELRLLLAEQAHPTGALLVRYTRNSAEVDAGVVQHIARCTRCRRDVAALQAYRQAVTPEIRAEAQRARGEAKGVASTAWRERLGAAWQAAVAPRRLRVWASATVVCLALLMVFVWRSQRVLTLKDGSGQWTLTRGGQLSGPVALPPDIETLVRDALQDQRAETPVDLAALSSLGGTHYHPAGTIVRSDRPPLSWEAVPNAESYQCTLTSPGDPEFRRRAPKPILTPFWQPKQPLPRGKIYSWQVTVKFRRGGSMTLGGAPRFKVMDSSQAQRLEEAAKTYADSHLTLGLLYAQSGDLEEAEQELTSLLHANPDSPVIKTLLDRLQTLHRSQPATGSAALKSKHGAPADESRREGNVHEIKDAYGRPEMA